MLCSARSIATRLSGKTAITSSGSSRILSSTLRPFSSNAPAKKDDQEGDVTAETKVVDPSINPDFITPKNSVELYTDKCSDISPHMIWGDTNPQPAPYLPEEPSEVSALDPAHLSDPFARKLDRVLHIRQMPKRASQSPFSATEKQWVISFTDEGEKAKCWDNPLMGWVSSADPMGSNMGLQMFFDSAKEAVYLCKKRGWKYTVEMPTARERRSDGAQYQDNFLPQKVAGLVKRDGKKCDHWHRSEAGCSHYFRPLTYHGDKRVDQYGPNGDKETDSDVEGKYKLR